ncbi:MAG: nucleotidyl transferase AbiEii/AbiGii toxin family protein [Candidatus Beckwithbacteria bacterium]|nr:nucleotidyl transferase AbiEii/AbiGii toxin family protein [Candidatus Beckwithbacteria bacterium]
MLTKILTKNQQELLPLISQFSPQFYLVGGTALTLQLGHRRSIDFDLFSEKDFRNDLIIKKINRYYPISQTYINSKDELTVKVNQVKMSWYNFPFVVPHEVSCEKIITMPDVLTISAMKVYALGQRAKWKDYVDLYFIFRKYSLVEVVNRASQLFPNHINERLLREQLDYFADVDYSEDIEYLPGMAVKDEIIKEELKKIAVS